jgi:ABC-type branched-subunit amino acid transport system substrate-binding protein
LATAEAALKAANAAGGVDGYKLTWKVYDAGSSPAGGLTAARLAVSDHDFAVIGNWGLPNSGLPALAAAGIPTIGDGDGTAWSGPSDLFSVVGNVMTQNTTAWWQPLISQGRTRIAMVGSGINPSVPPQWEKALPLSGGTLCFGRVGIDGSNSATVVAVAHEIISAHCQGVVGVTLYPGTLQLQIALNQLGANIPVVDEVDSGPAVIQQAGSSADNLIYTNQNATPYATKDPGIVQYLSDMKTYEPSANPYCGRCLLGYASVKWMLHAMSQLNGPATQKGLIDALNSTKNYTVNGLVAPITEPDYHTSGTVCLSGQFIHNGQWVPLVDASYPFTCGKRFGVG